MMTRGDWERERAESVESGILKVFERGFTTILGVFLSHSENCVDNGCFSRRMSPPALSNLVLLDQLNIHTTGTLVGVSTGPVLRY